MRRERIQKKDRFAENKLVKKLLPSDFPVQLKKSDLFLQIRVLLSL
jgi:hypothetical protein